MHLGRISPRIILALAIVIIAIVVAYRAWAKKDMMASKMLIAVALFLVGLHLLWIELHNARDGNRDADDRRGRGKRNGHKDDCGCDECKERHHSVLNAQE